MQKMKIVYWVALTSLAILMAVCAYCVYRNIVLKYKLDRHVMSEDLSVYAIVMVSVNAVAISIAFLAFFSVIIDSYPAMIISSYLLILLSLAMLTCSFYVIGSLHWLNYSSKSVWEELENLEMLLDEPDWYQYENSTISKLEAEFKCCGVYGWEDYWRPRIITIDEKEVHLEGASRKKRHTEFVHKFPLPVTCCDHKEGRVCIVPLKTKRQEGCLGRLAIYMAMEVGLSSHAVAVFGISAGIDAGFLFILSNRAKQYYYFYPYYIP